MKRTPLSLVQGTWPTELESFGAGQDLVDEQKPGLCRLVLGFTDERKIVATLSGA